MTDAYILHRPLTARRPARWSVHARYAVGYSNETVDLPAGAWLLALPDAGNGQHLYRLADGTTVQLAAPLAPEQAAPLTDRQAATALTSARPPQQAIREEWGLDMEPVADAPPFRLIACPLCGGADFTTVALASVWCDGCNSQFHVRHTAGDPGFVVDCTWPHLYFAAARYLLPRSDDLVLTLVYKSGGDPLAVRHSRHCHRDDCQPAAPALTAEGGSLRAGLHACELGDVYDWSFYGRVPTDYNPDRHGSGTLVWPDGREEDWPAPLFTAASHLTWTERQQLQRAAFVLGRHAPAETGSEELTNLLRTLADRPTAGAHVSSRYPWPRRSLLREGEQFLLYRWLVQQEQSGWITAAPVWLVVAPETAPEARTGQTGPRWRVAADNLCPACGLPVTADDLTAPVGTERRWEVAHGYCRDLWQVSEWRPTLFGLTPAKEACAS